MSGDLLTFFEFRVTQKTFLCYQDICGNTHEKMKCKSYLVEMPKDDSLYSLHRTYIYIHTHLVLQRSIRDETGRLIYEEENSESLL